MHTHSHTLHPFIIGSCWDQNFNTLALHYPGKSVPIAAKDTNIERHPTKINRDIIDEIIFFLLCITQKCYEDLGKCMSCSFHVPIIVLIITIKKHMNTNVRIAIQSVQPESVEGIARSKSD